MIITLTNGNVVVTRKPITFTKKDIPGTDHHRRYLVYTTPGRKGEEITIPVKQVQSVTSGTRIKRA